MKKPSKRVQRILGRIHDYTDEGMIQFDGLDEAIIGIGKQHGGEYVLIYSATAIIVELKKQGMSSEDAVEWYGHNIQCLYAGPTTPVIMEDIG